MQESQIANRLEELDDIPEMADEGKKGFQFKFNDSYHERKNKRDSVQNTRNIEPSISKKISVEENLNNSDFNGLNQYYEYESELKSIVKGKEWRKYEKFCAKMLKLLFGNELTGWFEQKSTFDNRERIDLIAKCSIDNEWKEIANTYNSRFVLFEFKNYNGMITQDEILTTQKYFNFEAKKCVAFIFCRNGADENAMKSQRRYLTENKLLIVFDDNDLLNMLKMHCSGESATDYIIERVDDFLMVHQR